MASLRQKIGQMIMVGLSGEELTAEEKSLFRSYPFGGFILFSHNCSDAQQIVSLTRSLWEIRNDLAPFISVDQEGGRVHRLPPPFTQFPAAAVIGGSGDPRLAYRAGRATAAELSLLGINLDFAPVLDVNSNPLNPVIADRAFGTTAQTVIAFSEAWMAGLRDGGIIPCGKHFPGHGDTEKDSHFDLPTIEKSLEELHATELPPFRRACQRQIECLMTAHVLFRCLDPDYPATLSHTIVTGLLRRELGYNGVVFGDDMEMKAITERYSLEEALVSAYAAGIDVVMYCHDQSRAVKAFDFIIREAEKDRRLRKKVDESYSRIKRLKTRSLRTFRGVLAEEMTSKLAQSDHQSLLKEIQGSL
jgi:beta-N-acetylhexosaminidase